MARYQLYTIAPKESKKTVRAQLDPAGKNRKYMKFITLEKQEYSKEEYMRLTGFVSEYFYLSYDTYTRWTNDIETPFVKTEGEKWKEMALRKDVVVKDHDVYGLLKESPYNTEYQVVAKENFEDCLFCFHDPYNGDVDNTYEHEYSICRKK